MALSVGGIASGIDTDNIISQLMTLEKKPIVQLQKKEAVYQLQLSNYGNMRSLLSSLQSKIAALDSAADFSKNKAATADSTIFTATAGSDAVIGTHNITVHTLAQAHKLTSSAFGKEENVGPGTLSIQLGTGTAMTVDVAADDTITDVANSINAKKGDVKASLVFDGTNYFLSLTGAKTGASNTIKVTVNDTGDGNNTDINNLSRLAYEKGVTENPTLTQTLEAKDATIDVDSITGITRSSNTLTDVITGVTVELVKAHANPLTESTKLTVSRDTSAITKAVDDFVAAYNSVVDFFTTNQSYDPKTKQGGPLLGDATSNLIQRRLNAVLNTTFSGMGTISKLSDLGITRNDKGHLVTSSSTLTGKLNTDFEGVVQFFTQTTVGAEGFGVRMNDELDGITSTVNGTLQARQQGIQRRIDDIQKSVERIEKRVADSEARMRAQFNALELLVSQYQSTGNALTQQLTNLQNLNTAIAKR